MRLLVGLGNPGPEHEHQRHNIGFMAVGAIHRLHGLGPWRARLDGWVATGTIGGVQVVLLKPLTYMNDSGRAAQQALRFYKLDPEAMVVFHDELDLPAGRIRVKAGGGHGGHNGLRSIDQHVGPHYWRVRLGIGHPGDRDRVAGYVLHDFARADRDWLDRLLDAVAKEVPDLVAGEEARFASRVALALNPPRPRPPRPAPLAKEQD
ncbi:MAG: aminoacyl-tRNA hydrolase [Alphaproteobacteria bacterium]